MAARTKATLEPELKEETLKPELMEESLKPEQAEATLEQTPKDAWDEEVEMYVPRRPKGEEQSYYICVNDRRFSVPANGKTQKLPRPVAEILQQSLKDESEADEYADSIDKMDDQPLMTM